MKSRVPLARGLLVVAAFAITACAREAPPTATAALPVAAPAAGSPAIPLTSTPPKDLTSRDASLTELAQFAWQELLALS